MAAHGEAADVVEEDDAGHAGRITGLDQQRAHQHVRPARFIDDGGTEPVKLAAEPLELLRQRPRTKGGPAGPPVDFVSGWAPERRSQRPMGRPVGVLFGADGSLFISDDASGKVYRVTYAK